MLLSAVIGHSQSNNPQNKVGADIWAAGNAIAKDYKEGKIKQVDQATIDKYYKALLPGYQAVKTDEFTQIANAMKGASSASAIDNSGFSETGKQLLKKSLTDYSQTALVNDVKASKINESEKTQILTVLAINYNMVKNTQAVKKAGTPQPAKGPNALFDINFDDPYFEAGTPQVAMWSALGAIIGFYTCGPWCAVAGGIIGIIIGSVPGSTTVSGPGGSHTYTNGGPKP